MSESTNRQEQKRQSRLRNNKTTIQLTRGNKQRLSDIQSNQGFDTLDEALDEVLTEYEDARRDNNE